MARENSLKWAFNRGRVSRLALARVDLEKRVGLSAEVQTNWMPRVLGSMMFRPGLGYVGGTRNDAAAIHMPFIFATDDTAIIEVTSSAMRVRVGEALICRTSVSTAVTSGDFSAPTGWSDDDEAGAASTISGGLLTLLGTGTNAAIRTQQVTVAVGDRNVEHALRIVVTHGPVTLRVGTSSTADDYIAETDLGTGTHSLALTPTGDFYVRFLSRLDRNVIVDSCTVEAAGAMEIATPWASGDLPLVRWDQSADVVYVACKGYRQRKIERRGTRSWSLVLYQPEDGPFRAINTGATVLSVSALTGNVTLSASNSIFRSTHVGALFKLTSAGQRVILAISSANTFANPIRVTGVGASRNFVVSTYGTYTATVTLQRSVGATGNWEDVESYTTNQLKTYSDGLDNQIVYYRLGVKTGGYTSGTVTVDLLYTLGSITGVVRVTTYTSGTSVSAEVLSPLGATTATADWYEGIWSDYRGWPGAVALYEGRLWWLGKDRWIGSVSDAYESFDDSVEGDSGPIIRTIGSGPVDTINWCLPLQRLMAGGQGAEHSARSTTFDEPLTPTNFNLKTPSTQGSAAVAAAKIDTRGVFVHRSGKRLFLLEFDSNTYDYTSLDLTALVPEIGSSAFTRIAVQRQPDTRVHCVRADGTVGVLVFDPAEDVKCWIDVETDGLVEDVFMLPGTEEDSVYYLVNRTVGGVTKRYLERWAKESECVGGTLNKQADSFVTYSGAATATVTAAHLAGETVVVWGGGADLGTVTLDGSGNGAISTAVTDYVVGLGYDAQYRSTKMAYGARMGTALTQNKRIDALGLILADAHYQGLRYGPDFDTLDDLPLVEDGAEQAADTIHESYDADMFSFNDTWNTDSRICLQASAPRPVTVLAVVASVQTNER